MNILKRLLVLSFVVIVLISSANSEYADADINYTEDVETSDEVPILEYVFKMLGCVVVSILFSLWFIKGVKKKKD